METQQLLLRKKPKTRPAPGKFCEEAVILAGGLSTRMGQDKARLRLGRETLLTRISRTARSSGLKVVVVRRDLVPRCGPLGGIYTGLQRTEGEAVLFLSCDMPFVTSDLIDRICARLRPGIEAVVLFEKGSGFPMVLRRGTIGKIEELLTKKEFSIQSLAACLRIARVRLRRGEESWGLNLNTPEDYAAALQLWVNNSTE